MILDIKNDEIMLIDKRFRILILISVIFNLLLLVIFIGLEMKLQISERMLSRLGVGGFWDHEIRYAELDYHALNSESISVHGIINYQKDSNNLDRLGNVSHDLTPVVRSLGKHTAGVRIRFKTDSTRLHISMSKLIPLGYSYPHVSDQASAGIDAYVDDRYIRTITNHDLDEINLIKDANDKNIHTVELYLPSFSPAQIHAIGLDKGSHVEPALPLDIILSFYGTSITQGASSPRSGLTYPAILSRMFNAEYYNYGFSANARGEPEIADILTQSEADIYVLEYSRQAADEPVSVAENLYDFCMRIKNSRPDAKILILTSLFDTEEALGDTIFEERRTAFRQAYSRLKTKYRGITLVEGYEYIGPDDRHLLADGTHPNSEGMSVIATKLAEAIREMLD